MNLKYNVAAYLRLSQEDGDKDISDSIISQKNIIQAKIKELGEGFSIFDYYIDDGYTGLNTNRPAFQKMLLDIENGKVNSIITKDLSRLSRNSFEANYYIEIYFLERNIRYISILDNVDTGKHNSNNDIIQFKTLINDWYSKDISRKIKSSIWARKEKGMYMAAMPPYGYRKSEKDKHKLVIQYFEAQVIKIIFKHYANGKSIKEIIDILNQKHIPSPNNNYNKGEIRYNWSEETIRRILVNKVYLGHIEYGKRINLSYKSKKIKYIPPQEWKVAYNTHEAIITQELFDIVQKKRNIAKKIKRKKHNWLLNGLVVCKECNSKMTLKVKYKEKQLNEIKSAKIYCLNGIRNKCPKKSKGIDEKDLNQIIFINVKNIISKVINYKKLEDIVFKENMDLINSDINKNEKLLYKQLEQIEKNIKIIYSDYKTDLLDEEDYRKFYKENKINKDKIEKEIELLENKKEKNKIKDFDEIKKLIKEIVNMKELNTEILSYIINEIKIDNGNKIYIIYKYNILG